MVRQMTAVGANMLNKTPKDEFEIFGDFIASELRKLSAPQYALTLLEAKQKITAAVHFAEMERIKMDSVIVVPGNSTISSTPSSSHKSSSSSLTPSPIYSVEIPTSDTSPHADTAKSNNSVLHYFSTFTENESL